MRKPSKKRIIELLERVTPRQCELIGEMMPTIFRGKEHNVQYTKFKLFMKDLRFTENETAEIYKYNGGE